MEAGSLLYKDRIQINDSISIMIPTVGDILEDESNYYNIVFSLTAKPIDMMVQLDDIGIDFTTLNEYDLFLLLAPHLQTLDTHLVFGDLDLSKFIVAMNGKNGTIVFVDRENDIIIDRSVYTLIANELRKIHRIEVNKKKPANEEARAFMIERERTKMNRNKNKDKRSQLEPLIVSMVNTEQYKYDFESTRKLSIFQFNECIHQIIKKINYDNRMHGVYAGTVNVKELSQSDLTWFSNANNN